MIIYKISLSVEIEEKQITSFSNFIISFKFKSILKIYELIFTLSNPSHSLISSTFFCLNKMIG